MDSPELTSVTRGVSIARGNPPATMLLTIQLGVDYFATALYSQPEKSCRFASCFTFRMLKTVDSALFCFATKSLQERLSLQRDAFEKDLAKIQAGGVGEG